MTTYKTPGVYVEEVFVLPPSVAEVETAVPAFIGYTEKAEADAVNDLILKPTKILSLKDYEHYFGGPKDDGIAISVMDDDMGHLTVSSFTEPEVKYLLYYSVKLFFDNGGGKCYITSVGTYQVRPTLNLTGDGSTNLGTKYGLENGLDAVALKDELTLIVIPEVVNLAAGDYATLVQAVLTQCGKLRDRFGVFDVFDGKKDLSPADQTTNRGYFGNNFLKYGAAYYPFIRTTINFCVNSAEDNVTVTQNIAAPTALTKTGSLASFAANGANANAAVYHLVKATLKEHSLVMPPSGAIAGVYAATDTNRGVWKAPANVSLTGVIEPVVKLDNAQQESLNVDATSGKSINSIRALPGKGTLVWGARTLAGNDNEWRYVPIRRFFMMVEESLDEATRWVVFEPNNANTWAKVRGMIENYLTQKWRQGALMGNTPKDAFYVHCGLGTTMTEQDITEGRMIVEIGMAAVRPAEFIVLKFSHMLPTS
jgi:phage tail sheath protein FI